VDVVVGSYSLSLLLELWTLTSPLSIADFRVEALLLRDEMGTEVGW
jgi:hypothetical protein